MDKYLDTIFEYLPPSMDDIDTYVLGVATLTVMGKRYRIPNGYLNLNFARTIMEYFEDGEFCSECNFCYDFEDGYTHLFTCGTYQALVGREVVDNKFEELYG